MTANTQQRSQTANILCAGSFEEQMQQLTKDNIAFEAENMQLKHDLTQAASLENVHALSKQVCKILRYPERQIVKPAACAVTDKPFMSRSAC